MINIVNKVVFMPSYLIILFEGASTKEILWNLDVIILGDLTLE